MSINSALTNTNTFLSATGTSTSSTSNTLSVVISGWVPTAYLDSLTITANHTITGLTATVVTDAAGYLSASDPSYILATATGDMVNGEVLFTFTNTHVEDFSRIGMLHVILTAASITAATVFTVVARGRPKLELSMTNNSRTPWKHDPEFRVLRVPVSGSATDLSLEARNGATLATLAQTIPTYLNADTEYLYIGSTTTFNKVYFGVNTLQSKNAVLTIQYWNGSTWATLTKFNNTSDGQASSFSQSGVLYFTAPSAWAKSQVTSDPLKTLTDLIVAGTTAPMNLVSSPDRYWIRMKLTNGDYPLKFSKIAPLV